MAARINNLIGEDILCYGWRMYLTSRWPDVKFEVRVYMNHELYMRTVQIHFDGHTVEEKIPEEAILNRGFGGIIPSDVTIATIMLLLG